MALSVNHSILTQRLKRLQQNAYMRKIGDFWQITEKGAQEIDDSKRNQNVTRSIPKALPYSINLNQVPKRQFQALYYPIKDPIPRKDLRLILQQAGLATKEDGLGQQHFTYEVTAELHSKYLMLFSPEIYARAGATAHEPEARAKALLDKKAKELEGKLNKIHTFKLKRIDKDTLVSYFSKEEIAHEDHKLSQQLEENKKILARHPIDNKQRLVIDASPKAKGRNIKELEPVHKLTAGEDSDVIDKEFSNVEATNEDWNALLDGKIHLNDINDIKELSMLNASTIAKLTALAQAQAQNQASLDRSVTAFTKEMKLHRQAYKNIANASKSIKQLADLMYDEAQMRKQKKLI